LLNSEMRNDTSAIIGALYEFLDDTPGREMWLVASFNQFDFTCHGSKSRSF
jgi:hypothetical protein